MTGPAKTDHAELGASNASRWIACPGSVNLSRGRASYETEYSLIGTAAHDVGAMALERGVDPDMWLGLEVKGVEVDEAMVEGVGIYVHYCRTIIDRVGPLNYWLEKKLSLEALDPPGKMFGTGDFIGYDPATYEAEVVDYKNGAGVVVEIEGNPQTRYYGLGAILQLLKGRRVDTIKMTIVQPNAPHPDGVIRTETIDSLELLAFAGELMRAAKRTLDPEAPLIPGKHCRFCPASAICPAQREMVQSLAQVAFEAMPLAVPPSPTDLPTDVFVDILTKLPILDDWSKAFYAEAMRRLERGELPGYKAVARKSNRVWVSPSQVTNWLTGEKGLTDQEVFTMKLKSPAQIEKLVGKKNLPADFTKKPETGYTMARDSDPRPAVLLHPGDAFLALPPASE